MSLSDRGIRNLQPRSRTYKCSDERGLYLEISPTGSKLWRMRYRYGGKDKRLALGAYPEVSLAEARRRRDEAREQLRDGVDPVQERRREKLLAACNSSNSFGDIAREYINKIEREGRSPTTIGKTRWLLELLAPIAGQPITEIKALDMLAALKRLEEKGNYETARRCRSFSSRVFRYAAATGRAEIDPTVVLRGALISPKVQHHAAILEPEEVGKLLRAIDAHSGHAVTRLAMQIAPHVMTRPGELRQAKWSEIDFENAVWKIPAERMKMRRPHLVPLSRQVIGYLSELYDLTGPEGYLFSAVHTWKRPMSDNTINSAFRRMGYPVGTVTAHGLRTTASTLLNESRKWSPDAIERSLAHADADAVRGIYNRGAYWAERVAMHQWWSDYLDRLRAGAVQRNVNRPRIKSQELKGRGQTVGLKFAFSYSPTYGNAFRDSTT